MAYIKRAATDGVYVCEDVSTISFNNGLFYMVDDFGDFQIKRAMRPSTFFKCVRGAMALVRQFESEDGANVIRLPKH